MSSKISDREKHGRHKKIQINQRIKSLIMIFVTSLSINTYIQYISLLCTVLVATSLYLTFCSILQHKMSFWVS